MSKITARNLLTISGSDKIGWSPASLSDCQLWWECDFSEKRGMDITAGPPDTYSAIPNLGKLGGTFGGPGGNEPLVSYTKANNTIRRIAAYDGATHYQLSSLAASNWAFLHQEATIIIVSRARSFTTGYFLNTNTTNASLVGLSTFQGSGLLGLRVANGSGTYVVNASTAASSISLGSVYITSIRFSPDFGYNFRLDGITHASGALVGIVSPANPASTAYLGARSGPASLFDGNILAVAAYNRVLTDLENSVTERHFAYKYQNNTAAVEQSPTFYLDLGAKRSYHQDIENVSFGEQADILYDFSGNAHDGIQNTDSKQGTIAFDSDRNREIEVDGTADFYQLGEGIGWPTGTDHSVWCEIDVQEITEDNDRIGIYQGVEWQGIADAVAGEQSLEYHFDDAETLATIYRNGVYIGDGYYTGDSISGDVNVFADGDEQYAFWDGYCQEIWHRDSLQSVTEIFESRQYRANKYPTRWDGYMPLVVPIATSATEGAWFDTRNAINFVLDGPEDGVSVVVNGDFETGSPPASWSTTNAIASAVPGARTGGLGTQYIGLTYGGAGTGFGYQTVLTIGNVYHISGWARGDGTVAPRVRDGTNWLWTGTSSTDWQYFDLVFTSAGTTIQLGGLITAGTVYFDDLSCMLLSNIIVAKDCSKYIDDPVTNGGFETGSPPAGWPGASACTPSSQAGARTGGSGSQILRGSILAGDNFGSMIQSGCLVSGRRNMVDIWLRGDGTNGSPRVFDGATIYTGTTSNTWQHCIVVSNASANDLQLVVDGNVATPDYAEFDDLVVTPGNHGYQTTSARRPVYDNFNKCMTFTAANSEYLEDNILSSIFTGSDKPFFIAAQIQFITTGGSQTPFGAASSVSGTPFQRITAFAGKWYTDKRDDAGTRVFTNTGVDVDTNPHVLIWSHSGTAEWLYLDGVSILSNSASNVGVMTVDRFAFGTRYTVAAADFFDGSLGNCIVGAYNLNDVDGAVNYLNTVLSDGWV